jgi:hypothetical protein
VISNNRLDRLYVLDQDANLLNIIEMDVNNQWVNVHSILRNSAGLFVSVYQNTSTSNRNYAELRYYEKPENSDEYRVLLAEPEELWITIRGMSPDGKQLLLEASHRQQNNNALWVFDTENQIIQKKIDFRQKIRQQALSVPARWIATMIEGDLEDTNTLYIFDCKTGKSNHYGLIENLLSWSTTANGFVVITTHNAGSNIEIVKP